MLDKSGNKVVSLASAREKRDNVEKGFTALPLPGKRAALDGLPAVQQMKLIVDDPQARALAGAFQPQEFYWLMKDIGEGEGIELLKFASPEQRTFILDMELWTKWDFSGDKAVEWLGYLLNAGEQTVLEQLPLLDLELLILIMMKEITVGGGTGDLTSDDERTADWDHSFDNIYFITFRNSEHARVVGEFLEVIYRNDQPLYQAIMEGVKGELESELEDMAYRFRSGRLADLGFPEAEDAISIYARLDPAKFTSTGGKEAVAQGENSSLPALLVEGDSLFQRALAQSGSEDLRLELNYLVNSALVADGTALSDQEAMQAVFQRVHGYLNIALEYMSGGDEAKAAAILREEYLKRLFQLGFSIVIELRKKTDGLSSDDYAANKALLGLRATFPRYYRALDPDGIDGYREFQGMADIRKAEELLSALSGV